MWSPTTTICKLRHLNPWCWPLYSPSLQSTRNIQTSRVIFQWSDKTTKYRSQIRTPRSDAFSLSLLWTSNKQYVAPNLSGLAQTRLYPCLDLAVACPSSWGTKLKRSVNYLFLLQNPPFRLTSQVTLGGPNGLKTGLAVPRLRKLQTDHIFNAIIVFNEIPFSAWLFSAIPTSATTANIDVWLCISSQTWGYDRASQGWLAHWLMVAAISRKVSCSVSSG